MELQIHETLTKLSSRRGTKASSSSKNTTHGDDDWARMNTCRTARSLSPTYYFQIRYNCVWKECNKVKASKHVPAHTLFNNSGPFTLIKFARLSLATAFARSVLPHPGGPHKSTPHGAVIPTALNTSGRRIGCTIAIWSSSLVACRAPTSDHVTSGIVANPSRFEDG